MNSLMRSLDRRFAFSQTGEPDDAPQSEENVKGSPVETPAKDVKDEVVETTKRVASPKSELDDRVSLEKTIHDLKSTMQETENKLVGQQNRTAEANERAELYKNQALEAAKQIASLKAELEARSRAYNALEKTNIQLKRDISEKEALATSYKEKMANASDKIVLYQNQAVDATKRAALLKVELDTGSSLRQSLEKTVKELQIRVQEAEKKVGEKFSEEELAKDNLKEELEEQKAKVVKLEEMLETARVEKEELAEQLTLHTKFVSEQKSREYDAHSDGSRHNRETEVKLVEVTQELKLRDSEVKDLKDNLHSLESQVSEATNNAEAAKTQLDEALQEIKKLDGIRLQLQGKISHFESEKEGLASTNLKLSQDMTHYETKLSDIQEAFEAVLEDKEEMVRELDSSRKTIEDLRQHLSAGGEKLQSQVSSAMDENNQINEIHQTTKKDLQATISELEEKLSEQKEKESSLNALLDSLQADVLVKSELQAKLEQQLSVMDKQFKAEKEELLKKDLERKVSLERHRGETEAKTQHVQLQEKQIEELKKMQISMNPARGKDHVECEHVEFLGKKLESLEKKAQIDEALNKWEVEASKMPPLGKDHVECDHVEILEEKIEELENRLRMAEADNRRMQQSGEGHVEFEREEFLEKKVEELEKKLHIAETLNKEKVGSVARFEDPEETHTEHEHMMLLERKVEELEQKLQISEKKEVAWRQKLASMTVELDGLRNTSKETIESEKKVAELEYKLQLAQSGQKPEGAVEAESRDFPLGVTKTTTRAGTITQQHHMGASLKFVIGIALVSIAIGVLLGKHVGTA